MARKPATREVKKPLRVQPKREVVAKHEEAVQKAQDKANSPKKVQKKESPKKKVVKKAKGAKLRHPPYASMIKKALKANAPQATSIYQLSKFIQSNYKVSEAFKRYLKVALNRMEAKRLVYKVRASYKLSAKASKRASSKSRSRSKSPAREKKSPKKESPKKKSKKEDDKEEKKKSPKKKSERSKKEDKPKEKKKPAKKRETSSSKAESPAKKSKTSSEESSSATLSGSKYDHYWQYMGDGGAWQNYDTAASDTVEEVYQNYLANKGDTDVRAVHSGQWEYMVDFLAMKQTNIQHPNHTVRNIRRIANAS